MRNFGQPSDRTVFFRTMTTEQRKKWQDDKQQQRNKRQKYREDIKTDCQAFITFYSIFIVCVVTNIVLYFLGYWSKKDTAGCACVIFMLIFVAFISFCAGTSFLSGFIENRKQLQFHILHTKKMRNKEISTTIHNDTIIKKQV